MYPADEEAGGYSVVMTAFHGTRYRACAEVLEQELAFSLGSAFGLCSYDSDYLPVEILDHQTPEEADRIAQCLRAVGAGIEVLPTREVRGVRYRAADCQPNRAAGGFDFTEVDGMILTLVPLNARKNARLLWEWNPDARPWEIERSLNHQHPSREGARRALRTVREFGQELAEALREAYPEREFVVSYQEEEVSFYQRGPGAPETTPASTADELPETAFCEYCKKRTPYDLRTQPDEEFPNAEWGNCRECGKEVLVRAGEELVLVSRDSDGA